IDLRKSNTLFSPITSNKINQKALKGVIQEYMQELKITDKSIGKLLYSFTNFMKKREDETMSNLYCLDKIKFLNFIIKLDSEKMSYGPKKNVLFNMINSIYKKPNINSDRKSVV